jgi:hypothetical protein
MGEPRPVGMSAVSMMSLIPTGSPPSGGRGEARSMRRAWESASSGSRNSQACTRGSSAAMRSRQARTSSSEVTAPLARSATTSAAPSW